VLDDGQRRGLRQQTRREGRDLVTGAADFDEHSGRVVADVADQTVFAGEPVDEGPEPDALHDARDRDVLGHALVDRNAGHGFGFHAVTPPLPESLAARRPPWSKSPRGQQKVSTATSDKHCTTCGAIPTDGVSSLGT
jgi:hypothetical protein